MAQTTPLAAGQAAATSSDIVVAAGASVTIGLFTDHPSGAVPGRFEYWLMADTPAQDRRVVDLGKVAPQVISGPGTYRVIRPDISANGVNVGVFVET